VALGLESCGDMVGVALGVWLGWRSGTSGVGVVCWVLELASELVSVGVGFGVGVGRRKLVLELRVGVSSVLESAVGVDVGVEWA